MPRLFVPLSVIAVVVTAGLLVSARPVQPPPGLPAQPTAKAPVQPVASDALDGTWELVSVIEDGKVIPLELVKQTMIKDARVVIKGQLAAIVRPDGKLRTLAFVADPSANPKTLDIAGEVRVGGKGIYMRDGDVLMICTRGSDSESRPTMMASLPGSDTFLMTFRRVSAPPPTQVEPPTDRQPRAVPPEDRTRKMLYGTWGHQNDEEVVKITLNPDGTFSKLTTYKRGFKKVFDHEDRSSGTWRLKDSDLILTVSASTLREKIGQVYSYRITSLTDSEVLYVDNQTGQRRIEWKLR